jgi:hypothetical protein
MSEDTRIPEADDAEDFLEQMGEGRPAPTKPPKPAQVNRETYFRLIKERSHKWPWRRDG